MRVNKTKFLAFCMAPLFFSFSYVLLNAYIGGDQVHYHSFYEALVGAQADDVMILARNHVSSAEPLSAWIMWVGANLNIDKNVYISLLNLFLLIGLLLLLRRYKTPQYIIGIVLSNFYVIVLMTGAERLKIAYIFLVYAALIPGKWGTFVALLSPLAHLQSIIFLISIFLARFSKVFERMILRARLSKRNLPVMVGLSLLGGTVLIYLWEGVLVKSTGYMENYGGLTETVQTVLLLVIASLVTKDRFKIFLSLSPLTVASFLLGGLRVNMIAVTVVFYIWLTEKNLSHPFVFWLLVYFTLKSIPFIHNIFQYGNGFGGFLF